MKTICVVTGTRAEYGLLRPLIKRIDGDEDLLLKLAVTGSHLSEGFGLTYREIIADGFEIDRKIDIEIGDTSKKSVAHSMSLAFQGFTDYFLSESFDLVVVLGDRYEIFCAATAAAICHIPVAHIHGGETTQGAEDEFFRHCITKMSSLHFTACEEYRKRVVQLGENPASVFNTGALGVENILTLPLAERDAVLGELAVAADKPYFLITFHPVTLADASCETELNELFEALNKYKDSYYLIFTKANADAGGALINALLEKYAKANESVYLFDSLGVYRYLSLMKYSSAVVGNSSSGIIEAPAFKVPTVNIGIRQKGRLRAESVIDCECSAHDISRAVATAVSEEFQKKAQSSVNPFGGTDTSKKMLCVIKSALNRGVDVKKSFYDIKFEI